MLPGRLLVIDASLSPEVANRLRERGREAVAVRDLGFRLLKDPPLLEGLARLYPGDDWVLVTADDKMPDEHGELIGQLGLTVATIDGTLQRRDDSEQMKREVVQRWAHAMATQRTGTITRYGLVTGRRWTKRKRRA